MYSGQHAKAFRAGEAFINIGAGLVFNALILYAVLLDHSDCDATLYNFLVVSSATALVITALAAVLALFPDRKARALIHQSKPVAIKNKSAKGLRRRCDFRSVLALLVWILSMFLFVWLVLGNVWTFNSVSAEGITGCKSRSLSFAYICLWDGCFLVSLAVSTMGIFNIPLLN